MATPTLQTATAREDYAKTQHGLLERLGVPARSHRVDLGPDLGRIHLLEAGHGPPLVLLHGGGGEGAEWVPMLGRLAKRFRVFVPDRPGHGLSDPWDWSGDLRDHGAAFLRTLLDRLGQPRASFVLNSAGALVGLSFALRHPERVDRLVLCGAFPGMEPSVPAMMRVAASPGLGRLLSRALGRPSVASSRQLFRRMLVADIANVPPELLTLNALNGHIHPDLFGRMVRALVTVRGLRRRYYIKPELDGIRVPVLVLWGDHETMYTQAQGRDVADAFPHGRFQLVADAGHLVGVDAPEATARAIVGFLEAPKRQGAEPGPSLRTLEVG